MARSASRGRRARAAAAPPRRLRRSALLPLALPLLGALALLAAADAQAQAPPTPTGLTLTAGDGQFTAAWNASPGAGTYVIRYAPQGGAWAAVFARPGTATSKTIVSSSAITISNGTTYWARIRACAGTSTGGANCSALSAAATVTPRAAPADPPPTATPTVSISASPNPVAEGARVTLKVTLSAALAKDVTIPVTTTRGTAERGDVPVPNYFMLIPSGETAAATTIQTAQDDDTDHETFILALAAGELPAGVSAGTASSVTVTIADDDAPDPPPARPRVSFASTTYSVHEGESVTLTVNIAPRLASASEVVVDTDSGFTARTPEDYTLSGATGTAGLWHLTLPADASSAAFTLSAVADGTAEGDEAVVFRLSPRSADVPYDVAATNRQTAVTISDPRPPAVPAVRLSASPATVAEGSPVTVTATLSAALAAEVTIPVTLTAGTAEPGDYGALASIRIPAGSASGTGDGRDGARRRRRRRDLHGGAGHAALRRCRRATPSSVTVTIADGGATTATTPTTTRPRPRSRSRPRPTRWPRAPR